MSHPIHILSIQIDTKSLELLINHQINNIKFSFFTSNIKLSFLFCIYFLINAVWYLDTLE